MVRDQALAMQRMQTSWHQSAETDKGLEARQVPLT